MKKNIVSQNYLEKIPKVSSRIRCRFDDEGIATLEVDNKGFMNWIAQKLLFKPKVSYIHLDELGSFALSCTDGKNDIVAIGTFVKQKFGDSAEPLYERLAKFYQIMDSYGFVEWVL